MIEGTIFQQGVRYAEYDVGGFLHSWWRKPKDAKADYVEKLDVLKGRTFKYDAEFNSPDTDEETDGWPRRLPEDLKPKTVRKPRAKAEDLLS